MLLEEKVARVAWKVAKCSNEIAKLATQEELHKITYSAVCFFKSQNPQLRYHWTKSAPPAYVDASDWLICRRPCKLHISATTSVSSPDTYVYCTTDCDRQCGRNVSSHRGPSPQCSPQEGFSAREQSVRGCGSSGAVGAEQRAGRDPDCGHMEGGAGDHLQAGSAYLRGRQQRRWAAQQSQSQS